jgi:hypothetical protein
LVKAGFLLFFPEKVPKSVKKWVCLLLQLKADSLQLFLEGFSGVAFYFLLFSPTFAVLLG